MEMVDKFFAALPANCPVPDTCVDEDGDTSLDWVFSQDRQLSISIGHSNRWGYAWVDFNAHGSGVVVFDGETIPAEILDVLTRLYERKRGA